MVSRGLLVQRMTYKDRYVLVFFFSLDLYFLLHNDGTGGLCKYIFLHLFMVEQCLTVLAMFFFFGSSSTVLQCIHVTIIVF